MSLIADGVSPTSIVCDGVDLVRLIYNGAGYWGKPFALTLDAGANTTITVTRTISRYQNAELGELSNGSLIYYGDGLSYTVKTTGDSTLTDVTVNGTSKTDAVGQTEYTFSIYVYEAVTISSTAYTKSWRHVYSGWKTYTTGITGDYSSLEDFKITKTFDLFDLSKYSGITAIRLVGQGTCAETANVSTFDVTLNVGDTDVTLTNVTLTSNTSENYQAYQKATFSNATTLTFELKSAVKVRLFKYRVFSAGIALQNIYVYY